MHRLFLVQTNHGRFLAQGPSSEELEDFDSEETPSVVSASISRPRRPSTDEVAGIPISRTSGRGRIDHPPPDRRMPAIPHGTDIRVLMRRRGIPDLRTLHVRMGGTTSRQDLKGLLTDHQRSRRRDGSWTEAALDLAAFLDVLPEAIFGGHDRPVMTHSLQAEADELQEIHHPEAMTREMQLCDAMAWELMHLPARPERVLRMRFGIGVKETSLGETGDAMGITREGVRQVEEKAMRTLRHPSRARRLRCHLDHE